MDRRRFMRNCSLLAAGLVSANSLDLLEKIKPMAKHVIGTGFVENPNMVILELVRTNSRLYDAGLNSVVERRVVVDYRNPFDATFSGLPDGVYYPQVRIPSSFLGGLKESTLSLFRNQAPHLTFGDTLTVTVHPQLLAVER